MVDGRVNRFAEKFVDGGLDSQYGLFLLADAKEKAILQPFRLLEMDDPVL